MSGHPHKEGVAKVRDLLLGQKTTGDLIYELRNRIAKDTATLANAQQTYSINARAIHEQMGKMDLTSSGNNGYEQRMQEFLIMLTELTLENEE